MFVKTICTHNFTNINDLVTYKSRQQSNLALGLREKMDTASSKPPDLCINNKAEKIRRAFILIYLEVLQFLFCKQMDSTRVDQWLSG